MSEQNIAEWTVENKLTYEELAARLVKSEAKIVSMKGEAKAEPKEEESVNNEEQEEKQEEASTEPEKKQESSQDELIAIAVKAALAEKEIENNVATTNAMQVDGNATQDTWFATISSWDFDKMSQSERSEYMSSSMKANWDEVVFS